MYAEGEILFGVWDIDERLYGVILSKATITKPFCVSGLYTPDIILSSTTLAVGVTAFGFTCSCGKGDSGGNVTRPGSCSLLGTELGSAPRSV